MPKDLEDRQREMRKRNLARKQTQTHPDSVAELPDTPEAMKMQIAKLEKRVLMLEAENRQLREEKTIVVERSQSHKSYEDSVREQRHNFFKYGNARRVRTRLTPRASAILDRIRQSEGGRFESPQD
ncbi:MAG: hypothetical protein WBX03_06545, partial [Terriglobales bacterium]